MKYILFLSLLVLGSCVSNKPIQLFTKKQSDVGLKSTGQTYLSIDDRVLSGLKINKLKELDLEVPYNDTLLILSLVRMDLFDQSFKVNTSNGEGSYKQGVYYKGVVKGVDSSIVSISIVGDEVIGVISDKKHGNLNLGKVLFNNSYAIQSQSVSDDITFKCSADEVLDKKLDSLKKAAEKVIYTKLQATTTPCVTVDFELQYEIFQHFGTTQASIDWFTALFAGVKALYANENINVTIKSFYVWTSDDGYDNNTASALVQFASRRKADPAFTGNLHQLVVGRTGGALSGIAYVGTLCFHDYGFSVTEPVFNFPVYTPGQSIPYSWSVEVVTHELGHNLGSSHTHACVWGPNHNQALDDCYKTEGGCPPGPHATPQTSTIMSYCHLTPVGINFANGFGKEPGDKIREFANSTCYTQNCTVNPPPPPPNNTNIALGKPSVQSSTYNPLPNTNPTLYTSDKANDGNIGTFNHTLSESNPWYYVDLGGIKDFNTIEVVNRKDCPKCVGRLAVFKIFVSNTPITSYSNTTQVFTNNTVVGDGQIVSINGIFKGQYVSIVASNSPSTFLHLGDFRVISGSVVTPVCKDTTIHFTRVITKDTTYKITTTVQVDSTYKVCK